MDRIQNKDKDLLQHFEYKQKMRNIKVSTIDYEVRMQLRQLNQPICCFGEDQADRRERLRHLIAKSDGVLPLILSSQHQKSNQQQSSMDSDQVWYHHGGNDLLNARKFILKYGIQNTSKRLYRMKNENCSLSNTQIKALSQEHHKSARSIQCVGANACVGRPISTCEISSDNSKLVTGQWDGTIRLWSLPNMTQIGEAESAHCAKLSSVIWTPNNSNVDLVSADHDGTVKLWSLDMDDKDSVFGEPLGVLEGLQPHRVGRMSIHPSGDLLVTPSHDHTWRMWDLNRGIQLQSQEGHTGPVTCSAWSPVSGSILLTADAAGYARLWDMRSGRTIMFMAGHADNIICADWSPRGDLCATGSADQSVKLWCLRQRQSIYTIASHGSCVTNVRFGNIDNNLTSPSVLMTSSLDKTVKLWAYPNWTPLRELNEHNDRVMHSDLSKDCRYLVSVCFDKQMKLWQLDRHQMKLSQHV